MRWLPPPCLLATLGRYDFRYIRRQFQGMNNLLTPCSAVLLEKLKGPQDSQEIPRILCNPEGRYRIRHSPYPRTYKRSLSLRFPHQNPVCTSPFPPIHATCSTNSFLLILSPDKHLATAEHKPPRHIFSVPLLLRPA
jgi:hypothetical protein